MFVFLEIPKIGVYISSTKCSNYFAILTKMWEVNILSVYLNFTKFRL